MFCDLCANGHARQNGESALQSWFQTHLEHFGGLDSSTHHIGETLYQSDSLGRLTSFAADAADIDAFCWTLTSNSEGLIM